MSNPVEEQTPPVEDNTEGGDPIAFEATPDTTIGKILLQVISSGSGRVGIPLSFDIGDQTFTAGIFVVAEKYDEYLDIIKKGEKEAFQKTDS